MLLVRTFQMKSQIAPNALRLVSYTIPLRASRKIVSPQFRKTFSSKKVTNTHKENKSTSGFVAWYEGHLETRPIITKMVTGCFLWGIGDAVGQVVPYWSSKNETKQNFVYDFNRTIRAAFFGFALHAPTSHLHFNFLEWMTQQFGIKGYAVPFFKAFMEQVCF